VLRAQIKGFFGQEGRHAHAHDRVNAVLRSQGFEIDRFLGRYQRIASWVEAHTPAKLNLAVTAAMEHFTAILAEGAFKYSVLDQAAPEMRRLHQLAATWMAARGIALLGQSYDAA
jgi:predicted metal-dependent hydrolase